MKRSQNKRTDINLATQTDYTKALHVICRGLLPRSLRGTHGKALGIRDAFDLAVILVIGKNTPTDMVRADMRAFKGMDHSLTLSDSSSIKGRHFTLHA